MKRKVTLDGDFDLSSWGKPKSVFASKNAVTKAVAAKGYSVYHDGKLVVKGKQDKADAKVVSALETWKGGTALASLATQLGMRRKQLKRQFVKLLGGKDKFAALRQQGAGGRSDFGGKRGGGRRAAAPVVMDDRKVKVLRAEKLKWRKSDAIIDFAKRRVVELVRKIKSMPKDTAKHFMRTLHRELDEMRKLAKTKKDNRWHWRSEAEHEPRVRKVEIKDGNGDKATLDVQDTGQQIPIYVSPKRNEYVAAAPDEVADLIIQRKDGTRTRLIRWAKSKRYRKASQAKERHEQDLERGTAALERKQKRREDRKKAKRKAERANKRRTK